MPLTDIDVDELVDQLDQALETRNTVPPLSEGRGIDSVAVAYEIQSRWNERRVANGDRMLGHKIGLTSRAMQEQIGVDQPDYGRLWQSRFFRVRNGRASIPAGIFLQPRIEGEFAFLMRKPLDGPDITIEDVLDATEAVAVSVEVIDSRFTDWKIRLVDTISDNASFGAFAIGPWSEELVRTDLRTVGMLISRNGEPAGAATGSAVLGHPANSVAWLATRLRELGTPIASGDVVLSGALGPALSVERGDEFLVETHGQPPLTVIFE